MFNGKARTIEHTHARVFVPMIVFTVAFSIWFGWHEITKPPRSCDDGFKPGEVYETELMGKVQILGHNGYCDIWVRKPDGRQQILRAFEIKR